jgi:hypothetical protein
MTETQRAYHELEMMQELGMLEENTNISQVLDDYVEMKQQPEIKDNTFVEIENQMVVGEYYNEGGESDE